MAKNSKREQLLEGLKNLLETIPWVKKVKRSRPTMDAFENIPSTQIPFILLEGKLPVPIEKKTNRRQGGVDTFVSELGADLYVFMLSPKDPDTVISEYVDDLWKLLYANPLLKKIAIGISLFPIAQPARFPPYAVIKIIVTLTYAHTTEGI